MTQDKDTPTSSTSVESPAQPDTKSQPDKNSQPESSTEQKSKPENKPTESDAALKKLEQQLRQQKEQETKEQTKQEKGTKTAPNTEPQATKTETQKTTIPPHSFRDEPKVVVKKSSGALTIFAFLFSLVAIAGVGFIAWQGKLWLATQQEVDNLKQQAFDNSQQTINQLQSRITQLQSKLASQNSTITRFNQSLVDLNRRTKELGQSQPNQWLAAEALYLVNLAERRLLVEQDITTAIQLLLSANVRLTAMNDPSVFPVRQALSEDIAALRAVVQPNTDDIYLTLSGLISQVQALPFAQVYMPDPVVSTNAPQVSTEIDGWQQNLKISLERFMGNFITVTRNENPVKPALPADQQWYVRSNITTQLLMAQQSVLEQKNNTYQDALGQSKSWLIEYLDTNSPAVTAAVTTIEAIEQLDVELLLPAQLSSQALLANFVQKQTQLKYQQKGQIND